MSEPLKALVIECLELHKSRLGIKVGLWCDHPLWFRKLSLLLRVALVNAEEGYHLARCFWRFCNCLTWVLKWLLSCKTHNEYKSII